MSTIVTFHSFRRGVGKTSLAVSLAALLTLQGRRVALVDTDLQSPSVHQFFGLSEEEIRCTLNHYLWNQCDILATVQDVNLRLPANGAGKLFVVPASGRIADIMRSIRMSPNIDRYASGLEKLEKELSLDLILVDSPAGLNENTLQTIAVSNVVVLVLHPDKHDFQGTAVTVDMIRRLQVPVVHLILNDVPDNLDLEDARRQLKETYHCDEGMVLKHSEELLTLSSSWPFVLKYPSHPLTAQIGELAKLLSPPNTL
ncbi:Sporulation initiation inhibitor protein Soj [Anaerolineales bacterium]|nr:Sporulation initiation inhibitor protein Soj [Anaerolineales bacterium]